MASLESLEELLRTAGELLDRAAAEIRDIPLKPEQNVRSIGDVRIKTLI